MRIAICDDDPDIVDTISRYIAKWTETRDYHSSSVAGFKDAENFLFHWSPTSDYDILFLDIKMDGLSGMELARIIRKTSDDLSIVFITNCRDHILDGYDVAALHYLLKPVSEADCFKCLDRAYLIHCSKEDKYLLLPVGSKSQRIAYDDIMYIEAFKHNIIVHGSADELQSRKNISEIETSLDKDRFIRIHRSYIVNIGAIENVGKKELTLDDKTVLPISSKQWTDVNRAFIEYHRKTNSPTLG